MVLAREGECGQGAVQTFGQTDYPLTLILSPERRGEETGHSLPPGEGQGEGLPETSNCTRAGT